MEISRLMGIRPESYDRRREALDEVFPGIWSPRGSSLIVGQGWDALLMRTFRALRSVAPGLVVEEIREKWGFLRIEYQASPGLSGEAYGMIEDILSQSEHESETICEVCGAPGVLRDDIGHQHVLCGEHYEMKRAKE